MAGSFPAKIICIGLTVTSTVIGTCHAQSDEAFREHKKSWSSGFSFMAGAHYYSHIMFEFQLATGTNPKINPLIPERSRFHIQRLSAGLLGGVEPRFFIGPAASYMFTTGYYSGFAARLNVAWVTDFKESVIMFRPDIGIHIAKNWQLLFGPNLKQGQGNLKDDIENFNLSLIYALTRKSLYYNQ